MDWLKIDTFYTKGVGAAFFFFSFCSDESRGFSNIWF